MTFTEIQREHWARKEFFDHYFSQVPCTYSMTVSLDITPIRQRAVKLYPAMLYCLSRAVNARQEFRMACNGAGEVGYYDVVHPCYTIFHKDTETFSNLWTELRGGLRSPEGHAPQHLPGIYDSLGLLHRL